MKTSKKTEKTGGTRKKKKKEKKQTRPGTLGGAGSSYSGQFIFQLSKGQSRRESQEGPGKKQSLSEVGANSKQRSLLEDKKRLAC